MWPFRKTKRARPEEFPAVIEAIREKLSSRGFSAAADRLEEILQGVWTTSNELYGELSVALRQIRRECSDLPPDIAAEVDRLIESIDHICPWR